jgi:hypothetical protein
MSVLASRTRRSTCISEVLFTFFGLHLLPDRSRTVIKPFSVDYPEPFRDSAVPHMRTVIESMLKWTRSHAPRLHRRLDHMFA